jgi:hypothetical protein
MRKGITAALKSGVELTTGALDKLFNKGYRFVQVKGLTSDRHFDYMEPEILMLVPMKELPTDPLKRDIYEPINSELLYKWASEKNEHPQVLIGQVA